MKSSNELCEFYNARNELLQDKATKMSMFLEGYFEGYNDAKKEQLTKDIDNACEALYGLMNDLGCDLLDIDKAKEYIRKSMCK